MKDLLNAVDPRQGFILAILLIVGVIIVSAIFSVAPASMEETKNQLVNSLNFIWIFSGIIGFILVVIAIIKFLQWATDKASPQGY